MKTTQLTDDLFLSWYDGYARDIYRYVVLRVPSREAAEDIVSEVFLSAWTKRASFDPTRASARTWLYVIAKHAVIDSYRRSRPQSALSDDLRDPTDMMEIVHWNLLSEDVQKALLQLSPAQREIIELRIWHGFSHAEIAEHLHKDEGAVRVMYHRALRLLKDQFPATTITAVFLALSIP